MSWINFFLFVNYTNVLISFLFSLLLTRRIAISMRTIRISIAVDDLTQRYDILIIFYVLIKLLLARFFEFVN